MPTTPNETEDSTLDTEQPEIPETPAVEAAQPDVAAQLEALRQERQADRAEMQQTLGMLREGFTALAASQQPRETVVPELSDEAIEQLLAEGKGAQAIRQIAKAETAKSAAALRRDAVDPLADLVNTHGIDAIAALAKAQAEGSVPESLKPYVDRYRSEIEQAIGGMTPALRLKVDNIKYAQNIILGGHLKDIIEEERQKVIRQYRENPGSLPGAAVGRQQSRGSDPAVPTADELYGKNSVEARMVREAGGEDKFIARGAQRSPHSSKTWAEHVQRHNRMHGQETEGNA